MNEFNPYVTNPCMPRLDYTPQLKQSPPQVKIFNVNGRAGAEAFNLAPDSSIFLLDSKDPVIWLVTTDSAATKTITRIKAVIEEEPDQQQTVAPNGELKQVNEKLEDVISRLDNLEKRFEEWEK